MCTILLPPGGYPIAVKYIDIISLYICPISSVFLPLLFFNSFVIIHFIFCFIVLYVFPSFLCVLSSLFFLLIYISVLDFCVQVYGQLLQGGNQIAVNKYHTVSYRQQQTIICHFTMCLLHVSASTWPSSKGF